MYFHPVANNCIHGRFRFCSPVLSDGSLFPTHRMTVSSPRPAGKRLPQNALIAFPANRMVFLVEEIVNDTRTAQIR